MALVPVMGAEEGGSWQPIGQEAFQSLQSARSGQLPLSPVQAIKGLQRSGYQLPGSRHLCLFLQGFGKTRLRRPDPR